MTYSSISHTHLLPPSPITTTQIQPAQSINFPDPFPCVLDSERVENVFTKNLSIMNKDGIALITVEVKQFLKYLIQELTAANITPTHIDAIGGAVAYMIGKDRVVAYASAKNIQNPNLSEFDRLQDLDIAIDLSGYPDIVLYEMAWFIIKALQRCGVSKDPDELFNTVLFRKIVKKDEEQALAIISL